MNRARACFVWLICTMFSTGCHGRSMIVKPEFWKDRAQRIGVGVRYVASPTAITAPYGVRVVNAKPVPNEEALDKFINGVDVSAFVEVRKEVVSRLKMMGLDAKEIPYLIEADSEDDKGDIEVTSVAKREQIDVLILFSIQNVGFKSEYHKNENVLEPKFASIATGAGMQRMGRKKMEFGPFVKELWGTSVPEDKSTVPLPEGWNEPPSFPKVKVALDQAMRNAKDHLVQSLFQDAPKP